MLLLDHVYQNPVVNVFVDVLARQRRRGLASAAAGSATHADASLRAVVPSRTASTNSAAAAYEFTVCDADCALRTTPCPDCGRCCGSAAPAAARGRHNAVVFRWFLALTLHHNVELRKYRKLARSTRIS
jgi:hypothetical protein